MATLVATATASGLARQSKLFASFLRITNKELYMKAYINNLPTKIWVLLVVPAVLVAYPVVRVVVPVVLHAVVPDAIRTVLSWI